MKEIILFAFIFIVVAICMYSINEYKTSHPDMSPAPHTSVKVFYTNGDSEVIDVPAYPGRIYLYDDRGSSELYYFPKGNDFLTTTAASGVRRFEIIKSNYK